MTPIDNRQETIALNHAIDTLAPFPIGAGGTIGATLGMIRIYGFAFEPNGALDADAQLYQQPHRGVCSPSSARHMAATA